MRSCPCKNSYIKPEFDADSCRSNIFNDFQDNDDCHEADGGMMCHKRKDMMGFAVAMAYVPKQCWDKVYPLNTGLNRGTIFPELDKEFVKGRCCR